MPASHLFSSQSVFCFKSGRVLAFILSLMMSPVLFAAEKVTLQLKWMHAFQFAGYYMAVEKGYYREAGLEVEIKDRKGVENHIQAVIEGQAEFGVADSSIILSRMQ